MQAIKKTLFFLLVLFLFSSLTKTITDYMQNISFYENYKAEHQKEERRNATLKTQITKNNDLYQLEKIIRNDLNLTRENEVTILVPNPTPTVPIASPTKLPVWQQWREVFFSKN